jgi:hypothetical protein
MAFQTELESRLRAAYARHQDKRSGVRLPHKGIEFEATPKSVMIKLDECAVTANMQTDAAAFEAWCLILKVWCEFESVKLRWDPPNSEQSDFERHRRSHYERFLYRVRRFSDLFDWFSFEDRSGDLERAVSLSGKKLTVNIAHGRSNAASLNDKTVSGEARRFKAEAELELILCESPEFKIYFGLDGGKVDRQLPVGLFDGEIRHKHRVFTGGKSAIDLVGMAGSTLWLFELKAGGNIGVGALSELLFYASVMRDVRSGRFQFPLKGASEMRVSPDDILRCERIEAVLLGERLHPLIGHTKIVEALNQAVRRRWNTGGFPPVAFHAASISRRKPLEFRRVGEGDVP